jgi:ABC-2 type transport system ATP-binding protein
MDPQKVIEISNLSKTFKNAKSKALDNINFSVSQGEFFSVLGPDASGKTTLMRILSSILSFDEGGKVEILGSEIPKNIADINHEIGYMSQKFGLYQDLSVMENLSLYADIRGVEKSQKKQIIEELLEKTNLKNFTTRLAANLSGGMKQKLALACTLVSKPKILLLDEVSVGVDPISRNDLISIVRNLASSKTTTIWSTTYLDEAENYSENIVLINNGVQIFFGKTADFINQTKDKTFLLTAKETSSNHRENLKEILTKAEISDAVLQGDKIRVLTNQKISEEVEKKYLIKSVKSNIEDSFLQSLKQKLPEKSLLAERYNLVENNAEKIVIEAQNLTKKFNDFVATDNVNFQIKSGQIFAFLGPNGAGKSTTFKMLCGLLKPTSGIAHISSISLLDSPSEARAKIGYMAQKFSLYSELSVEQNLSFFASIYSLYGSKAKNAIDEIIASLDLAKYLNINASDLPLGIKQRLALGCALIHKPEVLFLDEPTSGVDPATRREFWFHINALAKKNVTIMITTHFMDEAEYCDNVAIIYQGKKIAEDSPQNLKNLIISEKNPEPTFQDVFIELIKKSDEKNRAKNG